MLNNDSGHMFFSQRQKLSTMAETWCIQNNASICPLNIVTALSALGVLKVPNDRADQTKDIKSIMLSVCVRHGVSMKAMISKSRAAAIVRARHEAMHRCRQLTKATLSMIGEQFNRKHAAVLHAVKKISRHKLQGK